MEDAGRSRITWRITRKLGLCLNDGWWLKVFKEFRKSPDIVLPNFADGSKRAICEALRAWPIPSAEHLQLTPNWKSSKFWGTVPIWFRTEKVGFRSEAEWPSWLNFFRCLKFKMISIVWECGMGWVGKCRLLVICKIKFKMVDSGMCCGQKVKW